MIIGRSLLEKKNLPAVGGRSVSLCTLQVLAPGWWPGAPPSCCVCVCVGGQGFLLFSWSPLHAADPSLQGFGVLRAAALHFPRLYHILLFSCKICHFHLQNVSHCWKREWGRLRLRHHGYLHAAIRSPLWEGFPALHLGFAIPTYGEVAAGDLGEEGLGPAAPPDSTISTLLAWPDWRPGEDAAPKLPSSLSLRASERPSPHLNVTALYNSCPQAAPSVWQPDVPHLPLGMAVCS